MMIRHIRNVVIRHTVKMYSFRCRISGYKKILDAESASDSISIIYVDIFHSDIYFEMYIFLLYMKRRSIKLYNRDKVIRLFYS